MPWSHCECEVPVTCLRPKNIWPSPGQVSSQAGQLVQQVVWPWRLMINKLCGKIGGEELLATCDSFFAMCPKNSIQVEAGYRLAANDFYFFSGFF